MPGKVYQQCWTARAASTAAFKLCVGRVNMGVWLSQDGLNNLTDCLWLSVIAHTCCAPWRAVVRALCTSSGRRTGCNHPL